MQGRRYDGAMRLLVLLLSDPYLIRSRCVGQQNPMALEIFVPIPALCMLTDGSRATIEAVYQLSSNFALVVRFAE